MFEQFFSNFYDYSMKDILLALLDILIVWYLFYQILMLIRGTKAMQILFGLLIFVVFYLISKPEIFDLATLNWILNHFISYFDEQKCTETYDKQEEFKDSLFRKFDVAVSFAASELQKVIRMCSREFEF